MKHMPGEVHGTVACGSLQSSKLPGWRPGSSVKHLCLCGEEKRQQQDGERKMTRERKKTIRRWDLAWLWLWLWPEAVALIGLLAWEPPYAAGAALKCKKDKKTKQNKNRII